MGKATAWVTAPLLAFILVMLLLVGGTNSSAVQSPPGLQDPGGPLNPAGIPVAYVPLLQAAGGKYCKEITAAVLAAQIKQESGWNPNAKSPLGALGLSQFVPGTWLQYGKDANRNGVNSATDPADAIDAQARLMCDLVAMFRGKYGTDLLDLAWAGYNAGPGNVLKYQGIPPFTETRDYVRKLRENLAAYQQAPTGTPAGDGKFINPMAGTGYVFTSGFGPRASPGGIGSTFHRGADLSIAPGTPIKSACSGIVSFASWYGPGGNVTFVYCGGTDRVTTYYAHQTHRAAGITVNARVAMGQVIGFVGSTGNSTGPHLHFSVITNGSLPSPFSGNWIDPVPFMKSHGAPL